jgi:hypothetical protein
VIANVNTKNFTADWVSQYSGKQITDLQIMAPYFHYNNGEGFSCVPEVGAICTVCFPSDGDPPFIMGFLGGPEMEGASVDKYLSTKLKDAGVESEEDLPAAKSTTSGGSTTKSTNSSDASFRGGRPLLNPGDMLWQGRDENFVVLRRGGVLQIGATNICQRAYIPVLNYIRDFCENYELNAAAGTLSWVVNRVENDPDGNAPTEFTLLAREYAQDKKASIKVWVGGLSDADEVNDKTFVEVTIAPQSIDAASGELSGSSEYVLRIDKAGNTYLKQSGDRTDEIGGDSSTTIKGGRTTKITGDDSSTITGNSSTTIIGTHVIKGTTSKETWLTSKVITAPKLLLGSEAAVEPVPLGLKLVQWLAGHSHTVAGVKVGPDIASTSPPTGANANKMKDTMCSKTVTVNQ